MGGHLIQSSGPLIAIKCNRTDLVTELENLIGITDGLPWYIQTLVAACAPGAGWLTSRKGSRGSIAPFFMSSANLAGNVKVAPMSAGGVRVGPRKRVRTLARRGRWLGRSFKKNSFRKD